MSKGKIKIQKNIKIEDCKDGCNGNPEKIPFQVHNFTGERCNLCWRVINYKRTNNASS